MYAKIYIIDFDDSFTYNIANVLYKIEPKLKVISHRDFFELTHLQWIERNDGNMGIILGPGPGHPNDYKQLFEQIIKLKLKCNVYFLGICLGHQILALIDGFEIKSSLNKVHGVSELITFNNLACPVMRYNSLAVFDDSGNEVNWRKSDRFISYQFHPESVGTKNSLMFFQSLLNFLAK